MLVTRWRSLASGWILLIVLSAALAAAPPAGRPEGDAGMPKFQSTYGPAVLAPPFSWHFGLGPSLGASADRLYVGSRSSLLVLDRNGKALDFWPPVCATLGIGATQKMCERFNGSGMGGAGGVSDLRDIAVARDGGAYVLDRGFSSVTYYDRAGKFVRGWSVPAQPDQEYRLTALALSDDGYVYTFDQKGKRITRFSKTGKRLGEWAVTQGGTGCHRDGDLASAPSGVWLLDHSVPAQGTQPEVTNVIRYSSKGEPQLTLPVAHATSIAGNAGRLYVLVTDQGKAKVQRFDSKGTLVQEFAVDGGASRLAVASDGNCSVLVTHWLKASEPKFYAVYGVDTYNPRGRLVNTFGSSADYASKGALVMPSGFVATPAGDVYARSELELSELNYVTHFSPSGRVAEILPTANYPFYNVYSKQIEFLPGRADGVNQDGTHYLLSLSANWIADETPTGHFDLTIEKRSLAGALLGSVTTPGPQVAPFAPLGTQYDYVFTQEADGTARVIFHVWGDNWEDPWNRPGVLWVGKLDANLQVQPLWQTGNINLSGVAAVDFDQDDNAYVADGSSNVWKFSPTGLGLGRLGGWGGVGDQHDAPGSILPIIIGLTVDDMGNVRALDLQNGQIFYFINSLRTGRSERAAR